MKLVIIGGGSSYSPELISGLIARKDTLAIEDIVLVDVPEGATKLKIIEDFTRRMLKAAGIDWRVSSTLDRLAALKDADYVLTQFRVGQMDARLLDEAIPLTHRMIGQETNGAGGILKAFRTIEVFKGIVADMKAQCPDAWLINFTNPAGMITEAVIRQMGWKRTVGLCNIPVGQERAAREVLETANVSLHHQGVNHFHFHQVWDGEGVERTQEVIQGLYGQAVDNEYTVKNIANLNFNTELLTSLSLLPCDYHRYYFMENEMLDEMLEQFEKGEIRAQQVKAVEESLFKIYADESQVTKPKALEERGGAYYSEVACELVNAIENNTHQLLVVSTQNNGALKELPAEAIVETTCVITAQGPIPLTTPDLPVFARGYLQTIKAMEELTIQAALEGSYDLAYQAFLLNPLIENGAVTGELLQEMLVAHEAHLPQFKQVIASIKATKPELVERVMNLKEELLHV